MNTFWGPVLQPLLDASGARRVIEIGADAGKNTTRLARWCKKQSAFADIIDPKPQFDAAAFNDKWRGVAEVHLGLSLDVLPRLPAADVALIDGDHNWYTVYHEIRALIGTGDAPAANPPIMVFHDVSWPWGRRDAYYDIDGIPEEFRQPAALGLISPLRNDWDPHGVMMRLPCAKVAGGPRNGVRTAMEDAFADQRDRFRFIWIEAMSGLAIVVPLARIAQNPALAATLDMVTPNAAMRPIVEWLEYARLIGMMSQYQMVSVFSSGQQEKPVPAGERPLTTAVPTEVWKSVQNGMMTQSYKGRAMLLSPFDVYNYMHLIETLRPATIIEIGSMEGGRTIWMADQLRAHGIDGRVMTVDIAPPTGIEDDRIDVLTGNALDLDEALPASVMSRLPHPLLVIEDAAHTTDMTAAVLKHFDAYLQPGDYMVVEDGNSGSLVGTPELSPPHEAIRAFLRERGRDYELDLSYCDRFGYNVTANPNGWLKRL